MKYACDMIGFDKSKISLMVPNKTLENHSGSVSNDLMSHNVLMK